jgi:hypothetical protein
MSMRETYAFVLPCIVLLFRTARIGGDGDRSVVASTTTVPAIAIQCSVEDVGTGTGTQWPWSMMGDGRGP